MTHRISSKIHSSSAKAETGTFPVIKVNRSLLFNRERQTFISFISGPIVQRIREEKNYKKFCFCSMFLLRSINLKTNFFHFMAAPRFQCENGNWLKLIRTENKQYVIPKGRCPPWQVARLCWVCGASLSSVSF